MAAKKSRIKLFKVAKELNVAHQTITDFLEKKGYTVSGLNTPITEEMHDDILMRFSQEKVQADKIAKRRRERMQESEDEAAATVAATEEEHSPEEITTVEETAPEVVESDPEVAVVEEDVVVAETEEAATVSEEVEVRPKIGDIIREAPVEEEEESAEPEAEIEETVAEEIVEETEAVTDTVEVLTEEEPPEEIVPPEVPDIKEISPKVGDIIDHPLAKQFIEKEKEKARIKAEQKKAKAAEKEKLAEAKKAAAEEELQRKAAADLSTGAVEDEKPGKPKKKKEKKKKEKVESLSEKELRRRKALEMIRKEGKQKRPVTPGAVGRDDAAAPKPERKRKGKKRKEVDQQEVDDTLKKTLASMSGGSLPKKRKKKVKEVDGELMEVEENVIAVTEFITVQDLANLMDINVSEIISKCLALGQMVTINQRLDMEMIRLLAEDFGYKVEEEEEFGSDFLEDIIEEDDNEEDYTSRHPVVTVMGHVDHGKTSVLDYIRDANVVSGESGGITQHIGAYIVEMEDKRKITFLDTPGHEAFTAMRSRGAQVTDIVVLVVAADDRVMPQTEEAIDHAKAAGVPIVIAINKIDKPNANPQAIRQQLAERDILVEDWGGKYQTVDISAKTGQNMSDLLEKILLEAELLELKANPTLRANGVVVESRLDKGKGPVATVLIQQGNLKVGDDYIVGQFYGRVRALMNERNKRVEGAGPAHPVQVLGIDGVPEAGDRLIVMKDEKSARDIAQRRQQLKREQDFRQIKLLTLDEISRQIKEGEVKELNLLVKADVDGSAQALTDALLKLSTTDVAVKVVRRAVGPITESDVMLAAASQAIIVGFHVRPTLNAKELAETENVDIRPYKVIYDVIEDVKLALEGLLEPEEREQVLGLAEIREVFKISRIGNIGGCYMLNGKIHRNSRIRLIRNDVEIYAGKLSSLKRFKEDVREVVSGYECGMMIENYNDIKVGDHIEAFEIIKEKRKLNSK